MANFDKAYKLILYNENGYVNNPNDHGGETYAGISRKFNPDWLGWLIIDKYKNTIGFKSILVKNDYLQNLVKEFYKDLYWDKIKGDLIDSQNIANVLIDFSVNAGMVQAVKFAQKIVGTVQDGIIGVKTIQNINNFDVPKFLDQYADLRIDYYNQIVQRNPSQTVFLKGWTDRAERFRNC